MHEKPTALAVLIFVLIVVPMILFEIKTTRRFNAVIRKLYRRK